MAQTDLYRVSGVVTLGGVDVGLATALAIQQQMEEIPRLAFGGTYTAGGVTHLAQRVSSVRIEFAVYEIKNNLVKLLRASGANALEGVPATAALTFAGFNKADGCAAVALSAPLFLPIPTPTLPLLTEGWGQARLQGHVVRNPAGSPQWYSLTIA